MHLQLRRAIICSHHRDAASLLTSSSPRLSSSASLHAASIGRAHTRSATTSIFALSSSSSPLPLASFSSCCLIHPFASFAFPAASFHTSRLLQLDPEQTQSQPQTESQPSPQSQYKEGRKARNRIAALLYRERKKALAEGRSKKKSRTTTSDDNIASTNGDSSQAEPTDQSSSLSAASSPSSSAWPDPPPRLTPQLFAALTPEERDRLAQERLAHYEAIKQRHADMRSSPRGPSNAKKRVSTPRRFIPSSSARDKYHAKSVEITKWQLEHDLALLQIMHQRASEHLKELESDYALPPMPASLNRIPEEEKKRIEKIDEKMQKALNENPKLTTDEIEKMRTAELAQRPETDKLHRATIVSFLRRLRAALHANAAHPDGPLLREWLIDARLGHTVRQSRLHYETLSHPETNIKPAGGKRLIPFVMMDKEDELTTLDEDEKGESSTTRRLRLTWQPLLRYAVYSLPRHEGTIYEIIAVIEKLASNGEQIENMKFEHFGRVLEVEKIEDGGQQFVNEEEEEAAESSSTTAAVTDGTNQLETAQSKSSSSPRRYSLIEPPPPPPRFALSLGLAQGRWQGFTYERTIKAGLCKFPEYSVKKKVRVTLVQRNMRGEVRPAKSRTTNVYSLNLRMLKLEQEEAKKRKQAAELLKLIKKKRFKKKRSASDTKHEAV